MAQSQERPHYFMFHVKDTSHQTRDCPIFLESKKMMTQKHSQPSQPKKLTIHLTGTNHHNHHPQINLRTKISTLTHNTNPTTKDTLHSITSNTTTRHTQTKSIHPTDNYIPSDTFTNNIPSHKLPSNPTKKQSRITYLHLHRKTKIPLNKPPVSQPSKLYTLSPEAPT
jgi:hypothetical protein